MAKDRKILVQTIAVLVTAPLLYFVSSGPALRYVSRAQHPPKAIKGFYDPLLHSRALPILWSLHQSYLDLRGVNVVYLDSGMIHDAVLVTATP
ncbi:hypothetical protein CfE428DRAFT_4569 [Chthoniobacter flavus Ellin428]|uniref:Uncharacterized protein n=1 Tax=Chthoniobacter flavus Ellin428 TaxID=497964 RepID=B4D6M9_9BACT|nr:hypothetical protein [Chthoniobacter flavus]EDY17830.1 hypothetical protein CfE428DRAFT_4569 [Chthoniobacter flavus Ellin428]TCO88442.1 hypothetical protein EV701_11744 [Chthoniobacter flavus]